MFVFLLLYASELGLYQIQIVQIRPEPDSVMAAPLQCMLTMCMKLYNVRISCSELMSII